MCSSDALLTAFIPLHDCDESNGTLVVADGSHLWRELPESAGDRTPAGDPDYTDPEFCPVVCDEAWVGGEGVRAPVEDLRSARVSRR